MVNNIDEKVCDICDAHEAEVRRVYEKVCQELQQLQYTSSMSVKILDEVYDKYGLTSYLVRMQDKLSMLSNNSVMKINDAITTLYQLANQAILAIIKLEEESEKANEHKI